VSSNIIPFDERLKQDGTYPLKASGISVFQLNLGRLCNQACKHCHVEASPDRTELMSKEVINLCLDILAKSDIPIVDITGGAPEMHPMYCELVAKVSAMGKKVMTRCNLTICTEEGYEDMPSFYKKHSVEVLASLPYFKKEETDKTRGRGVYDKSIEALKKLNEIGYGIDGSELMLHLVYSPAGLYFPPSQQALEVDFKRELDARHGISFNSLYSMLNMPIGRFAQFLKRSSNYGAYMKKLESAYNLSAASNVMCKNMLSVDWQGHLYDCDFNQMLDIKVNHGAPSHISKFNSEVLKNREIMVGSHCYGCTAGSGSSCGGATTEPTGNL